MAAMIDRNTQSWLRYSSVGLELAVAVFVCTGGGYWLDEKTGLLPLFTLLGAVFGMGAGFWQVCRVFGFYPGSSAMKSTDRGREGKN